MHFEREASSSSREDCSFSLIKEGRLVPAQHPRRRLLGIARATAWLGSTSLVLLAGCVDAPGPATSGTLTDAVEVASSEPAPSELTTPEATTEATPTAAETPDPDGWVAAPARVPESQPHPTESIGQPAPMPSPAEPTLAAPTPIASDTAPAPFPTSAAPTLAETEANPKPLEVAKPRTLLLISPRNVKPLVDHQVASTDKQPPPSEQPAVILPPSPAADAALLSPLAPQVSVENPVAGGAAVTATSVAALDPKSMLPSLTIPADTTSKTQPGTSETPASPISISRPITELPPGFTALFNNKDLTGWEVYDGKSEAWQFKEGEVSCVAPGGGWLQTLTLYTDFELRFEYRLSPGGNSGVCLRFSGHGNPSLEGLEIQLLDDRADKYQSIQAQQATGSLYFVTAPKVRNVARVAGEWNQCTLRCVGNQLQVTINDQLVNEIDLGQLPSKADSTTKKSSLVRCPMGSIALQSHSTRIDFRQVGIRDLTQAMESGVRWLDLQAGTGDPVPAGAKVTVHYIGFLSTGKRFANSFEKNKPVTVPLKDVIPGWREGIPGMQVGGKRRLIVPASMAYGAKGFKEIVPPNSTLVYEIELTGFEKPAEPEKVPVTAEASSIPGAAQ